MIPYFFRSILPIISVKSEDYKVLMLNDQYFTSNNAAAQSYEDCSSFKIHFGKDPFFSGRKQVKKDQQEKD